MESFTDDPTVGARGAHSANDSLRFTLETRTLGRVSGLVQLGAEGQSTCKHLQASGGIGDELHVTGGRSDHHTISSLTHSAARSKLESFLTNFFSATARRLDDNPAIHNQPKGPRPRQDISSTERRHSSQISDEINQDGKPNPMISSQPGVQSMETKRCAVGTRSLHETTYEAGGQGDDDSTTNHKKPRDFQSTDRDGFSTAHPIPRLQHRGAAMLLVGCTCNIAGASCSMPRSVKLTFCLPGSRCRSPEPQPCG